MRWLRAALYFGALRMTKVDLLRKSSYFLFIGILLLLLSSGCTRKTDEKQTDNTKKGEFGWHDNITKDDIPDFPVKGYLGGKEVQFLYINFERWRGSNDNVINFSLVKPAQNCGSLEEFTGFTLMNKGGSINQGEWIKSKFPDDAGSYQAFFKTGGQKSSAAWNCALVIESITDKTVKGKIALFFNDDNKSWVTGKFDAIVCNN
ncbi:MAG TPA: hypothetical protein VGK25_00570 [Ignavibacteria bacterium]|jgi:hypothetical protein